MRYSFAACNDARDLSQAAIIERTNINKKRRVSISVGPFTTSPGFGVSLPAETIHLLLYPVLFMINRVMKGVKCVRKSMTLRMKGLYISCLFLKTPLTMARAAFSAEMTGIIF